MNFTLPNKQPPPRSQQKKDLYKLLLARSDVSASLQGCKLLLEKVTQVGDDLYYPLYSSIVVCYARPFTNNEPYGALPNKWAKFDNSVFKDTHDKLIQARHELIAHSDMNVRKAYVVPPGCLIGIHKLKELRSDNIGCQVGLYYFPVGFFTKVWDTATDLSCRITKEINRLTDMLYCNMELPLRAFEIRIDDGL